MYSDIKDFFSLDDDPAGAFVLTSMWWDDDFAAQKMIKKMEKNRMNRVILMGRLTRNPEIKYEG